MKKYRFQATINGADGGGAYVLFPFDVAKEFGTKGKVPVQARFNGIPYRGSLIKYGNPLHMLPMLKSVREQTGRRPGHTVEVELWKDEKPRIIEAPAPFREALKRHGILETFDRLSYTHRREYCRWIMEAKKEETRVRRIEKALELLKKKVKTPDAARRKTPK